MDNERFNKWHAVKGYPPRVEGGFTEHFGVTITSPSLKWVLNGQMWENNCGGNQNLFWRCEKRSLTKGEVKALYDFCEAHGLWFVIEEGLTPDTIQVVVSEYDVEFEYK